MNKQSAVFYNRFSFFYPVVDIFLKPQKKLLLDEVNRMPEGKLLEIGVGNGTHLPQYKKHKITGIDTSAAMLDIARKNRLEDTELFEMSGEALLFADQFFDYVVLSHVIAVVENPEQLLQEVHRVLKPKGHVFILNHFTPENWLRHIDHSFEMIARSFHFNSVFRLQNLQAIEKFKLKKEIKLSMASYFRLLIYQKS